MRLFLISFFSCKLAMNQAGKEGTIVTSSKVRERLIKETDNNVTRKSLVLNPACSNLIILTNTSIQKSRSKSAKQTQKRPWSLAVANYKLASS
jgi:hypothetical protein